MAQLNKVFQVLNKTELLEKIKSRKERISTTQTECIEDNGIINPLNEDSTLKKLTTKRKPDNLETNSHKVHKKRKFPDNNLNIISECEDTHTQLNTDVSHSIQDESALETTEQTHNRTQLTPSPIISLMQEIIHIPSTLNNSIESTDLKIPPFLITVLRNNSISDLFPIQSSLLPALLSAAPPPLFFDASSLFPSDICVSAPTGSGKTLCYLLPILARLSSRVVPRLRALIVLPTRDLANQVHSVFTQYAKRSHLNIHLLTRDISMLCDKSDSALYPDVIVCTPGRLVDSLKSKFGLTLDNLEFLVVDEADRLLDQSYHEWIPFVTSHLPHGNLRSQTHCRKLLFSATLTMNPEQLSQLHLYRPVLYTIEDSRYTLPPRLTQFVYTCASSQDKLTLLYYVLKQISTASILCFTNSKEITSKLYLFLSKLGFNVKEFSSQLNEKQRRAVFNKFSKKQIDILICTDTMARGIDIQNVRNVINYDCPPFLRNYVHRVGRTARALQEGSAHTLLEKCEVYHFKKMIKETNSKFQMKRFNSFQLLPYKDLCSTALAQIREEID